MKIPLVILAQLAIVIILIPAAIIAAYKTLTR